MQYFAINIQNLAKLVAINFLLWNNRYMDIILKQFNSVQDKLYFHHTLTKKEYLPRVHGPESHNRFELLYLTKGTVDYFIEGEKYSVNVGDCIFVSPNEIHKLYIKGDCDYERTVVVFDPSVFDNLLNENYINLKSLLYQKSSSIRVIPKKLIEKSKIKQIISELENSNENGDRFSIFFSSKILLLILELDAILSDKTTTLKNTADPLIKSIVQFINDNIENNLSLKDISSHFFISSSSLSHKFKSHMDMSVKKYISLKKIHYASELIKNGVNATECAKILGFEHYTTFFSSYKKIFGKPPKSEKEFK